MTSKFYMVWSPNGTTPPRVKHEGLDGYRKANEAARQMAQQNPGQQFYVMQAIEVSVACAVQTAALKEPGPF